MLSVVLRDALPDVQLRTKFGAPIVMLNVVKKNEKKPRESVLTMELQCVPAFACSRFHLCISASAHLHKRHTLAHAPASTLMAKFINPFVYTHDSSVPYARAIVDYLNQFVAPEEKLRLVSWDMARCQKDPKGNVFSRLEEIAASLMKVRVQGMGHQMPVLLESIVIKLGRWVFLHRSRTVLQHTAATTRRGCGCGRRATQARRKRFP